MEDEQEGLGRELPGAPHAPEVMLSCLHTISGHFSTFLSKSKVADFIHSANLSGFYKTKYPVSHFTELHVSSKMRHAKNPLVNFVSLLTLIKIFVKGIYCLSSIFCSDVAALDITLWSIKTQNINASHSRKKYIESALLF